MKYLCLGYLDADAFDSAEPAVKEDILKTCGVLCKPFRATGKILAEERLDPKGPIRSIRSRGGKPIVTDGPFCETKEQLGSYFIVEADSLEEAVEIASMHPAAQLGEHYSFGLDVRPIG